MHTQIDRTQQTVTLTDGRTLGNAEVRQNALKEVGLFFALTLGLSFLVFWGPLALFQITAISFVTKATGPAWAIALFMLGGFVPSLLAVALTGLRQGKAGLKQLWQRTIQVKLGWRAYGAAVGLVLFGSASQIALQYGLGHRFDFSLFLSQLPSFLPLILIGPLSEELGWRGYAQSRLQTRWNPLVAAGMVGAAWGLWHLPLFLMPGTSQHELGVPFAGFFVGLIGLSVLFAWLQNQAGGSVWMAVFFHWIYTYAGQVVATGVTRSPLYNWLEYTPYLLAAIVIAVLWRGRTKLPA